MGSDPKSEEIRKKIIHKLVTRIEVKPDTFRIHFRVGGNYVEGELAHAGSESKPLKRPHKFFSVSGSNLVENGAPARARTWDPRVRNTML